MRSQKAAVAAWSNLEADSLGDSDLPTGTATDLTVHNRANDVRKRYRLVLSTTLTVLVPVLFVVLLGYVAGRAKAFDADQVAGINKLALDFALPASLFVGIVSIPRVQLVRKKHSFVLVVLAVLVGLYLFALVVGILVLRLSPSAAALFRFRGPLCRNPVFGPAVLGGLFGPSSAVAIASIAIVANLLLVPASVVVLEATGRVRPAGAITLYPRPSPLRRIP